LQGEREGLDWGELETEESVLRLLSGLLKEHTLSMDTLVFLHASHEHSPLHLETTQTDARPTAGQTGNETNNHRLSELTV